MEKWKNRDDGKRWMRNATRSDLSQVGVYGKSDKPEELNQFLCKYTIMVEARQYDTSWRQHHSTFFPRRHK